MFLTSIPSSFKTDPQARKKCWLEGFYVSNACRHGAKHEEGYFHSFQTLPTRSGPGFKVVFPGSHPAGQTSLAPVCRTCWYARICRRASFTFLPTGGDKTSMAWITPSGSMRNFPRMFTPASSLYTPYNFPKLPPPSETRGKGMPPSTILDNSFSSHILCTALLSTLMANTSTPSF